jgi:iron(III) transport system ATP-binding protein
VARALVLEPQVLLFDEPLSNLDAKLRRRMREDIRDIQTRLGLTSVYVTHDQEEALAVSDKIVVMNRGRIAQEGTPADLYERPADAFVADFIGSANLIPAEIVGRDKAKGMATVKVGDTKLDVPDGKHSGKVYLVIRPTAVKMDVGSKAGSLAATVEKATYLGSHWEYTLKVADWSLYVVQPIVSKYEVGDDIRIGFLPQQLAVVAR